MPEYLKSASLRSNSRAAPQVRASENAYIIAPPPAYVVPSTGPQPIQQPANEPQGGWASVIPSGPAPTMMRSSGSSEADRILHALKEHEQNFVFIEKALKEMSAVHASFAEAIKGLRRDLNEVSLTASQADQNVLTLASNIEANLGALDNQLRNQGEAITALTRGVVETFAPRQVTVPGASKRRAKIATVRKASASQAVVDATPGEVSPGEPVSEKAMAMFHGLIVDDN